MNELTTSGGDLADVIKFSEMVKNADGLIPKHLVGKPGAIAAAILAGRELGVPPMAAMRAIHVVQGRPCADYTFWLARMKQCGYRIEWLHSDSQKATIKITSKDGDTHVETYTFDMAKRALLTGKDNWKAYPEAMLKARATTAAGRAFCAEVMMGVYELDEAEEIEGNRGPTVTVDPGAGKTGTSRLAARIGAPAVAEEPHVEAEPAAEEPLAKQCADLMARLKFDKDDIAFAYGTCKLPAGARLRDIDDEKLHRLKDYLDNCAERKSEAGVNPELPEGL